MTPHQILTLCIRLVALVWLLYTVSHVHELFAYLNEDQQVQISKTAILTFALFQIAMCALLWLFPRSIAAKLLPGLNLTTETPTSTPVEWQTLGVICIGIWALTRALPDATYWFTYYNIMTANSNIDLSYFTPDQKAAMISTITELAIGLWLLLGAKGVVAILFKARSAGIKQ